MKISGAIHQMGPAKLLQMIKQPILTNADVVVVDK